MRATEGKTGALASPDPTSLAAVRPPQSLHDSPLVSIGPGGKWVTVRLRELWTCRELLCFLTWREVKVRYKQTLLGAAWALLGREMNRAALVFSTVITLALLVCSAYALRCMERSFADVV